MKIIFVCTGNTCRSPIAEGYLKSLKLKNLEVLSRGFCKGEEKVSENSAIAAKELGFDISSHISAPLLAEDMSADKIICMSFSHQAALIDLGFDAKKISVLGGGVPDPFGGDLELYRLCAQKIINEIDKLLFEGFFGSFEILSAQKEDARDIAALEKMCFSMPWSENAIVESMANKTSFFIAKKDDVVLGYIGISAILDEGYITNLAVNPNSREKGIGSYLILRVLSFARQRKLSFVSLEVRKSNQKAIKLYEKYSFLPEGVRKNFYSEPLEDAIIMTRR